MARQSKLSCGVIALIYMYYLLNPIVKLSLASIPHKIGQLWALIGVPGSVPSNRGKRAGQAYPCVHGVSDSSESTQRQEERSSATSRFHCRTPSSCFLFGKNFAFLSAGVFESRLLSRREE